MNLETLRLQIEKKKSLLCVGLDSDIEKIPHHLHDFDNPVLEFNKTIIDATKEYCVAYKINTAFYESMGSKGWDIISETEKYISGDHFKIADAKRGDIGNTSKQYAKAFFEALDFDAVTVAPYMGKDSVEPFLHYDDKYVIILALTSNPGSSDFELLKTNGHYLYEEVIKKSQTYTHANRIMYVAGATQSKHLKNIREKVPESFLLVPGIGAQGGSLEDVIHFVVNKNYNTLINSSRSIIFAGKNEDFASKAANAASQVRDKMAILLEKQKLND